MGTNTNMMPRISTPQYTLDWIVYERLLYVKFTDTVTVEIADMLNTHLTAYLEQSKENQINLVIDASALTQWDLKAIDVETTLTALFHEKVRWLLLAGAAPQHAALALMAVSNARQKRIRAVAQVNDAIEFLRDEYLVEEIHIPA